MKPLRLSLASLFLSPALTLAAPQQPNILFVLSDDQSAAHVACYGNPDVQTPNIDRLAKEGIRFERAYVASPQCVPSRASLMTGRSPVAIDMTRFSAPLPAEYKVYPEILRSAGYFSGVAGRTYHLDGGRSAASRRLYDEKHLETFPDRLDFVKSTGERPEMLAQYEEFLDAVPAGKPFCLQLCFSDPHRPYTSEDIPSPRDPAKLTLPPFYPDTPMVRKDLAAYYDEIQRFDGDLGKVLEILEKRGLAKNTIVVFMGDNGSAQFRGKGTLFELGIRVPLVVRWPGVITPGSTSADLISGEDLAPTLLEAAGQKAPQDMTGKSFLPRLRGETYKGRDYAFSERGAHASSLPQTTASFDLGRVVVGPTHKLIYNALWQLPYFPVDFGRSPMWQEIETMHKDGTLSPLLSKLYFPPTRPMFELYDLVNDPYELNNLAGQTETNAIEADLKQAMHEWMITERDYLPLPVAPPAKNKKKKAAEKAAAAAAAAEKEE
jgi:N-sulfoglucosamine sulfohydrolase